MRHDYTTRSLRSILLDCLDYIESDPVPTTRGKRLIDEGHAALIETAVAGRGRPQSPHNALIFELCDQGKSVAEIVKETGYPATLVASTRQRWTRAGGVKRARGPKPKSE